MDNLKGSGDSSWVDSQVQQRLNKNTRTEVEKIPEDWQEWSEKIATFMKSTDARLDEITSAFDGRIRSLTEKVQEIAETVERNSQRLDAGSAEHNKDLIVLRSRIEELKDSLVSTVSADYEIRLTELEKEVHELPAVIMDYYRQEKAKERGVDLKVVSFDDPDLNPSSRSSVIRDAMIRRGYTGEE